MMKAFLQLIAVFSLGFFVHTNETADIHIKKGSHISISGSSNVNRFTCHYTTEIAPGCQEITYDYISGRFLLKDATIHLESKSFDCGGKLINRDFNELMKSDEYPFIEINFKEIEVIKDNFIVYTEIEIADEVNQCSFTITKPNNYNYMGNLELNIEDFGMKAPKKLLGAIKVDPNIVINFDMNLEIKNP